MKLPLRCDLNEFVIWDADTKVVCDMGESGFNPLEDHEHMRQIVAACNSHEALAEVAEKLIAWDEASMCPQRGAGSLDEVCELARKAIAKK